MRDAGDQPAAANRHDNRVEIAQVGEQFECDRPLSGNDGRVVVGVYKAEAPFAAESVRGFAAQR